MATGDTRQATAAQSASCLRVINHRISSTPTRQLPHSAPHIAASLRNIKSLLSASQETIKSNAELSSLLHRFRTTLNSLLQDRSVEGRWAGVVLAKAVVEIGGTDDLSKSASWVKSLLAMLKKRDPPTTRTLSVIVLTRIFMLTWDTPTLVREITTPALPNLIASCLDNLEQRRSSVSETQCVLEAFATLIPRHPTIFRTFEARIRKCLLVVLSLTPSHEKSASHHDQNQVRAAQRLLTLLHHCATKQAAAGKWEQTFKTTLNSAHQTCDQLFRAVIEISTLNAEAERLKFPAVAASGSNEDPLYPIAWEGIYAGAEHLIKLLGVLQSHFELPTVNAVALPVGQLLILLGRLLNVTVPRSDNRNPVRINTEMSRDEREALFASLPSIHVATLRLLDAMVSRFRAALTPSTSRLVELVAEIFHQEQEDVEFRAASYQTLRYILEVIGPSMSKHDIAEIVPLINACCFDLLPTDQPHSHSHYEPVWTSAERLLPVLFAKINQVHIPRKTRIRMERTAVLTSHREALIACVMSPSQKEGQATLHPSLMPLLARLYPSSPEVEVLLRPRMPVMVSGTRAPDYANRDDFADSTSEIAFRDNGDNVSDNVAGYDAENNVMIEEAEGGYAAQPIDSEDLYSSTPQPAADNFDRTTKLTESQADLHQPIKRQAADGVRSEVPTKRLRASPMAEATSSDNLLPSNSIPLSEHGTSLGPIPIESSKQVLTTVVPTAAEGHTVTESLAVNGESDDEDLDIPEINADPDTDSEADA